MPVLKSRPEKNYTVVPNPTVAQNPDLTMKERGLLLLLLSLPEDWEFRISDLVERIPGGRDALRSAAETLEEKSFVYREERRKSNGARTADRWYVFDVPRPEFSPDEKPRSENPTGAPSENPTRAQIGKSDPNKRNNQPSTKETSGDTYTGRADDHDHGDHVAHESLWVEEHGMDVLPPVERTQPETLSRWWREYVDGFNGLEFDNPTKVKHVKAIGAVFDSETLKKYVKEVGMRQEGWKYFVGCLKNEASEDDVDDDTDGETAIDRMFSDDPYRD